MVLEGEMAKIRGLDCYFWGKKQKRVVGIAKRVYKLKRSAMDREKLRGLSR